MTGYETKDYEQNLFLSPARGARGTLTRFRGLSSTLNVNLRQLPEVGGVPKELDVFLIPNKEQFLRN